MKVTMLLADSAQAVGGKLYILGGGWSVTGPGPSASAIALKIEVPWDETNRQHKLLLKLLDSDGRPVLVPSPTGEVPLEIPASFEVGRPAGLMPGTPIDVPAVISIGPVQIPPGRRYVWRLSIDGRSEPDWEVAFSTRPAPQKSQRPGS